MIATCLIAMLIIFGVFAGWVMVQQWARRFAARHPGLGPAREEGGTCGMSCGCAGIRQCPYANTPNTDDDEQAKETP
jgi:hypothetical protein